MRQCTVFESSPNAIVHKLSQDKRDFLLNKQDTYPLKHETMLLVKWIGLCYSVTSQGPGISLMYMHFYVWLYGMHAATLLKSDVLWQTNRTTRILIVLSYIFLRSVGWYKLYQEITKQISKSTLLPHFIYVQFYNKCCCIRLGYSLTLHKRATVLACTRKWFNKHFIP